MKLVTFIYLLWLSRKCCRGKLEKSDYLQYLKKKKKTLALQICGLHTENRQGTLTVISIGVFARSLVAQIIAN